MQLINSENVQEIRASEKYVTGIVKLKILNSNNECHISDVTFSPNARTHWHSHPHTQILIGKQGHGFVQKQDGKILSINVGDIITIPANEIHWHGAGCNETFVHTAIQVIDDSGFVTRRLTEEEYNQVKNIKI
jgi:quercetin dioxygenase-like cupin family protein